MNDLWDNDSWSGCDSKISKCLSQQYDSSSYSDKKLIYVAGKWLNIKSLLSSNSIFVYGNKTSNTPFSPSNGKLISWEVTAI